jgi:hypothetical protein
VKEARACDTSTLSLLGELGLGSWLLALGSWLLALGSWLLALALSSRMHPNDEDGE